MVCNLKYIKLLVCGLLIFINIALGGDLFQDYLRHFEYNFNSTSFYLPYKVNGEEMTSDLLEEAKKHNVRFFTISRTANGVYNEEVNIFYSDESIIDEINDCCGVEPKTYPSLFFGTTSVKAEHFKKSSEKYLSGEYYLVGNQENMYKFKMSLMNKYNGGLIKDGYNPRNDHMIIFVSWCVSLIIFVLICLFESSVNLKKDSLLILMGTSYSRIILKNILSDVFFILLCYIVSFWSLRKLSNPYFSYQHHILFVILFLITDIASHLKILKVNIQKVLKGKRNDKSLLVKCYTAKYISVIITILLFSANLIAIHDAISWKAQEKFWEKYSSYNQMTAALIPNSNSKVVIQTGNAQANYEAYSYFFNKADATLMSIIAEKDFFGQPVVAYNKNCLDYLKENIDSVNFDALEENKVYALLPAREFKKGFSYEQSDELNRMANYLIDWDGSYNEGAKIIYYDDRTKLLALNRNSKFESNYYKNPIILFVNIDEELYPRINTGDDNIGSNTYFTMYNISPTEFESYLKENVSQGNSVRVIHSSIEEQYKYRLGVAEKTLYIFSFITALLLMLNVLITLLTIRIDYSVNSTELSLKKIMGFSIFETHKKLVLGNIICSILSIAGASLFSFLMNISVTPLLVLFGLVFVIVDMIFISSLINKTEQAQIAKILKGGAL